MGVSQWKQMGSLTLCNYTLEHLRPGNLYITGVFNAQRKDRIRLDFKIPFVIMTAM